MVKRNSIKPGTSSIEHVDLLKVLIEFRNKRRTQPPVTDSFFVSGLDRETVKIYYELKKKLNLEINKTQKDLIKRLPCSIWILRKYVFEIIFLVLILILLVLYMAFIQQFRGKVSFFIGFSFIIWSFSRLYIRSLDSKVILIISTLIDNVSKKKIK